MVEKERGWPGIKDCAYHSTDSGRTHRPNVRCFLAPFLVCLCWEKIQDVRKCGGITDRLFLFRKDECMTLISATPQRLYLLQLSTSTVAGAGRTLEMVSDCYLVKTSVGKRILIVTVL